MVSRGRRRHERVPQKILVATDGSADAERATEAASDLTRRAELHVVHVWHDVPGFAHDFAKRELKRQGQETLDEQVEKIRGTGAEVTEAHLRGGRTSNEVIALSEEIGGGLLIVGSRGLGTVQRILMGSQSEEIARLEDREHRADEEGQVEETADHQLPGVERTLAAQRHVDQGAGDEGEGGGV